MEGFKLSISTEKAEYAVSEPIKLQIVLKNTGPSGVRYTTDKVPELDYPVVITLSIPDWIPFRVPARLTEEGRRRVDPGRSLGSAGWYFEHGKERSSELEISAMYDMTTPGTYKVQVSKRVPRLYEKGFTTIQSNQISVTVREEKGER
jgi:hypothetical protein